MKNKLGIAIRAIRKEEGLTQIELAEKCFIRPATVSDIENGKNGSMYTLVKICEALNVELVMKKIS